jgi:hypothetical protein
VTDGRAFAGEPPTGQILAARGGVNTCMRCGGVTGAVWSGTWPTHDKDAVGGGRMHQIWRRRQPQIYRLYVDDGAREAQIQVVNDRGVAYGSSAVADGGRLGVGRTAPA